MKQEELDLASRHIRHDLAKNSSMSIDDIPDLVDAIRHSIEFNDERLTLGENKFNLHLMVSSEDDKGILTYDLTSEKSIYNGYVPQGVINLEHEDISPR